MQGIQPSLRDLFKGDSIPGSELPGYCQISLREMGTFAQNVWTPARDGQVAGWERWTLAPALIPRPHSEVPAERSVDGALALGPRCPCEPKRCRASLATAVQSRKSTVRPRSASYLPEGDLKIARQFTAGFRSMNR